MAYSLIQCHEGSRSGLMKISAISVSRYVITAADHWLTTLGGQERLAHLVIQLIEEQIAKRDVSPEGVFFATVEVSYFARSDPSLRS